MSVGNIVVRLELNDGQFTSRMSAAGRTIGNFSNTLTGLDKRVSKVERGLVGFIPRLRDIAIVAASARVVIHGLSDTIGGFTSGVIKSNAEIERLTVLLGGISNANTESGKLREAGEDIGFLFDMAQRAPFSIKELSNSFVKMKAAGIEDVTQKIQSLTDSIARFGGDEQTLHRATIAIQQMASKGVVSMEELRQQLGEAVPNAMNLMADGMGMTMRDMVKAISEGRVKAIPAIDAMMEQMNATMKGSSERMMKTWNGLMSRLSTRWTLLQKEMGDAGVFSVAKEALIELNQFMDSDQATSFAQSIGGAMRDFTVSTISAVKWVSEFTDVIGRSIKAMLTLYAGAKLLGAAGGIASVFVSGVKGVKAYRMAIISVIAPTKLVTNYIDGVAVSTSRVAVSATVAAKAMGAFKTTVTALGGPLNIVMGLLTLGAAAWVMFGDKGDKAIEKLKKSREGLEDFKAFELKISTSDELESARVSIERLEKKVKSAREEFKNGGALRIGVDKVSMADFGGDIIARKQKALRLSRDAEVITSEKELAKIKENFANDAYDMIVRQAERTLRLEKTTVRESLAGFNQAYKDDIDAARTARDAKLKIVKEGSDEAVKANEDFANAVRVALKKQYELQSVDLRESVIDTKSQIESLSKNIQVGKIIDLKTTVDGLETDREAIIASIAEIELSIDRTNDVEALSKLRSSLDKARDKLSQTTDTIVDTKVALELLTGNTDEIDFDKVVLVEGLLEKLPFLNELLHQLGLNIDKVGSIDSKDIIDPKGADDGTKALNKLQSAVNSIIDKNAGLKDALNGGSAALGRQRSKLKRLAEEAGNTKSALADLSRGLKEIDKAASAEATLEVIDSIGDLDEKIARLRANLNEGDPNATLIYKVKKMFDGGLISDATMKDFNAKISELNEKLAQKESVKQGRWVADQLMRMQDEVLQAQIATSEDEVAIEKFAVDARIKELNRLADAKKLTGGLRESFIQEGAEASKEARAITSAKRSADLIDDINRKTAEKRIGLIDDAYQRERALLELSIADEKEKHQLVLDNVNATVEQEKKASKAIKALDDLRLASIEEINQANKSAFETMLDDYSDVMGNMDNLAVDFVDGFTDSMADLAIHGTKSFGDFATSVLEDITKMIIKAEAANLINLLLGRKEGDAAPGGIAGLLGGLLNSGKEQQPQIGGGAGDSPYPNSPIDDTSELAGRLDEKKSMWGNFFDSQIEGQNAVLANSQSNNAAMTEDTGLMSGLMSGSMGSFIDMTIGGFAAMAANGKTSMGDLLKTVLSAIAAMIVKYLALAAVKAIAGFAGGGTAGGENSASFTSSMDSFNSDAAAGISGFGVSGDSTGSTYTEFAKGGLMKVSSFADGGAMKVSSFADGGAMKMASQLSNAPFMSEMDMKRGGVKKSPHVALFAEASMPEAFIPMEDGKNIPLMLSEDADGNVTGQIPLPSGQILPTKVVGDVRGNVSAFAKGGVMGSGGISSGISSSASSSGALAALAASMIALSSAQNFLAQKIEAADFSALGGSTDSAETRQRAFGVGDATQGVGDEVSIAINVNVESGGKSSESKEEGKNDAGAWPKVAERIKSVVVAEIAQQQRPGGILWRK